MFIFMESNSKLTTDHFKQRFLIFKTAEKEEKSWYWQIVDWEIKEGYSLHQADLFKEKQIIWIFPVEDLLCFEQKFSGLEI